MHGTICRLWYTDVHTDVQTLHQVLIHVVSKSEASQQKAQVIKTYIIEVILIYYRSIIKC